MQTTNVSQRNNVTETGTGAPILFAHGYGCDQHVWRHITPAFSDRRVILFDHVGSGESDLSAFNRFKYRSLQGYATDILELCDELALENVTLVGHSVSAVIGALAVIQRPELFSSLVMIAPSPCYIDHDDYVGGFTREDINGLLELLDSNHFGWFTAMAPVIMGNPERPELGEQLAASFCRTDPDIARHFARVTFLSNNLEDVSNVKIPALILQCAQDAIAPASVGDYLHRVMDGSELVNMTARGHCPHLSAPTETTLAIKKFLTAQESR